MILNDYIVSLSNATLLLIRGYTVNAAAVVGGGVLELPGSRGRVMSYTDHLSYYLHTYMEWLVERWGPVLERAWAGTVDWTTWILVFFLVGLGFFIACAWVVIAQVSRTRPELRRRRWRRTTRGRGRPIRRAVPLEFSSLRDECIRLLSLSDRGVDSMRDVRRKLQELARRDGILDSRGAYIAPEDLAPALINSTVEKAVSEALTSGEIEDVEDGLVENWDLLWIQHYISRGVIPGEWTKRWLGWEMKFRIFFGLSLPMPRE